MVSPDPRHPCRIQAETPLSRLSRFSRPPLTIAEAGLPGYAAISWQMVAAPTGTPRPIIDRMAAVISKASADPAFKAKVAETGAATAGGTVDEARSFVKEEAVKWREVVIRSGAKAD
jgi:tripartite-type tricarboxylate transporter receptor subunit TctC